MQLALLKILVNNYYFKYDTFVNVIKNLLKLIRYLIVGNKRINKLSDSLVKIIQEQNKSYSKSKIRILDYGSGYEPYLINLIKKKIKNVELEIDNYDIYTKKQIKYLNSKYKMNFYNIKELKNNNKSYSFVIISDVLHHINSINYIKKVLINLNAKTKFLIIKDHFEYNFFSRQCLRIMDFFGNYYRNVSIPKKYFTEKCFLDLLHCSNIRVLKKYTNIRYYPKLFFFLSNPKLHFIYLCK